MHTLLSKYQINLFALSYLILLGSFFLCPAMYGQATGTIEGKIFDEVTKEPLLYANVMLKSTSLGTTSDAKGYFLIEKVPPGEYTLVVSIIGYKTKETENVRVEAGKTLTVDVMLSPAPVEVSEVTVYAASFRRERITEAPAAVSVIEPRDLKLFGVQGQVPKLLENHPGVDMVQSGLYDFNINTRGFNSSLNRRLLVLLDGRDLAIVFLGAQEWNGLSVPVEDLGRIELVRGPGSALYGANAFNGVVNITTPSPRQIVGTKLSLAVGELSSIRTDVRHAGISGPWSYRVNIGRFQGDTWSKSRVQLPFEYAGFSPLNVEVVPVNDDKIASTYGSARVDYDLTNDASLVTEGGFAQVENEIFVTGIGRVQVMRAQKPWGRVSYSTNEFNIQAWASGRTSKEPQVSLSTGLPLHEESLTMQGDAQYHFSAIANKLLIITGLSFRYQSIDTKRTLMLEQHKDNMSGLYGQLEYSLTEDVKTVFAARWDRSTLHPSQFSPKVAVVWSIEKNHSVRWTYNHAFQAPNYSELNLYVLHPTSALAYIGNNRLDVEQIDGFEIGYKGIFQNSLFVTVDGYYNQLRNFITDLAPGLNPEYEGLVFLGGRDRTVWSYANAGIVDERGLEVGINYYVSDEWILDANYAYFDHNVVDAGGVNLSNFYPNSPKHKLNGGITFRSMGGYEVGAKVKYVPSFDWSAGIFQGRILAYTIVDLSAKYHLTEHFDITANVANLLNREHYEIFGGSMLGRRAMVSLTATF